MVSKSLFVHYGFVRKYFCSLGWGNEDTLQYMKIYYYRHFYFAKYHHEHCSEEKNPTFNPSEQKNLPYSREERDLSKFYAQY